MTIDCSRFTELADELALGLLAGAERAVALAHLDECHSCRAELSSLTEAADELLLLAPSIAPDPGFERRVLSRIGGASESRRRDPRRALRPPRFFVVAAAAAALIAFVVVGGLRLSDRDPATPAAAMRTPSGAVVGTVSLHDGPRPTIETRVPQWRSLVEGYGGTPGDTRYWLQLDHHDGSRTRVPLDPRGDGSWNVAAEVDDVSTVAVVDEYGHVWCSAHLS